MNGDVGTEVGAADVAVCFIRNTASEPTKAELVIPEVVLECLDIVTVLEFGMWGPFCFGFVKFFDDITFSFFLRLDFGWG